MRWRLSFHAQPGCLACWSPCLSGQFLRMCPPTWPPSSSVWKAFRCGEETQCCARAPCVHCAVSECECMDARRCRRSATSISCSWQANQQQRQHCNASWNGRRLQVSQPCVAPGCCPQNLKRDASHHDLCLSAATGLSQACLLAEMVEDFTVLAAELERCFGADQVLPARSDLREMNRWA